MLTLSYKKLLKTLFSIVLLGLLSNSSWANSLPILSGVGGDFSAISHNKQSVKLSDYKDKIILLAFGYTNCADICPFTLGYLKALYEGLSAEEQQKVQVLFVSIDPDYDTPEHLKGFIEYFNKHFIGLTGTHKQVDHIVSLFQAEYHSLSDNAIETKDMRRVNPKMDVDENADKAKLFTHSVTIYLIDKQLRVRGLEYTGTPKATFANEIRELIHE